MNFKFSDYTNVELVEIISDQNATKIKGGIWGKIIKAGLAIGGWVMVNNTTANAPGVPPISDCVCNDRTCNVDSY